MAQSARELSPLISMTRSGGKRGFAQSASLLAQIVQQFGLCAVNAGKFARHLAHALCEGLEDRLAAVPAEDPYAGAGRSEHDSA